MHKQKQADESDRTVSSMLRYNDRGGGGTTRNRNHAKPRRYQERTRNNDDDYRTRSKNDAGSCLNKQGKNKKNEQHSRSLSLFLMCNLVVVREAK
mmetsp:Transcript_8458/g.13107  ORF Transcript_8458/g.13107 Transcript_8458/m.13107 type:complete len:95 (+) Transcript_8458:144-428(+)